MVTIYLGRRRRGALPGSCAHCVRRPRLSRPDCCHLNRRCHARRRRDRLAKSGAAPCEAHRLGRTWRDRRSSSSSPFLEARLQTLPFPESLAPRLHGPIEPLVSALGALGATTIGICSLYFGNKVRAHLHQVLSASSLPPSAGKSGATGISSGSGRSSTSPGREGADLFLKRTAERC